MTTKNNPSTSDQPILKSYKWSHYAEAYKKHLPASPGKLLEIGVAEGGSLLTWRNHFPDCEIHGVDYNAAAKKMEQYGFIIHIMNQAKKSDLLRLPDGFDVIIDDGGHRPYQILRSFEVLFPKLKANGVYVIEDLHMSEKIRWQIWQKIFGGPRTILLGLYHKMNLYVEPDAPCVKFPFEIHLYPHIIYIIKKSGTVEHTEKMISLTKIGH
jgi:hypothetical protein